MRIALIALLVFLVAACGGSALDAEQDDIQGGRKDSGHPAVGMVRIAGGGFCTGTLIAPQVVLTAAHCVTGTVLSFSTSSVDRQVAYPSYRGGSCPNGSGDVGLIHLAEPLNGVAPMKLASKAPAAGVSCTAVGFGDHDGTSGQKRSATETVVATDGSVITVHRGSGIADHGDSGGPLLCGSAIAGTTSCHVDSPHLVEYYARVDALRSWIEQTVVSWR